MAASLSTISCCQIKPPAPAKQPAAAAHLRPKPQAAVHLPHRLRRACIAAAACVMIGAAAGTAGCDGTAMAREMAAAADAYDVVHAQVQVRWSDHRQCPPWRANSLENTVPENLPRPSARRRFNSITAAERALASPDAVAPFLALHSGMGCFSL